MVAASLADIRAALKTQLSTLLATAVPAGPFASVISYAGRASRVDLESLGNHPSCVIALERESFASRRGTVRTLRGTRQAASEQRWNIFVVIRSATKNELVADDDSDQSLSACIDAVLSALVGFRISGLAESGEVELVESLPEPRSAGIYAHKITVRTARAILASEASTADRSFVTLDGDVNLEDTQDEAPNPVVEFLSDPPDA